MPLQRLNTGTYSISGRDQNGWSIALFFHSSARTNAEVEVFIVAPDGFEIANEERFSKTDEVISYIVSALGARDWASCPDLTVIPSLFIERTLECLRLQH